MDREGPWSTCAGSGKAKNIRGTPGGTPEKRGTPDDRPAARSPTEAAGGGRRGRARGELADVLSESDSESGPGCFAPATAWTTGGARGDLCGGGVVSICGAWWQLLMYVWGNRPTRPAVPGGGLAFVRAQGAAGGRHLDDPRRGARRDPRDPPRGPHGLGLGPGRDLRAPRVRVLVRLPLGRGGGGPTSSPRRRAGARPARKRSRFNAVDERDRFPTCGETFE